MNKRQVEFIFHFLLCFFGSWVWFYLLSKNTGFELNITWFFLLSLWFGFLSFVYAFCHITFLSQYYKRIDQLSEVFFKLTVQIYILILLLLVQYIRPKLSKPNPSNLASLENKFFSLSENFLKKIPVLHVDHICKYMTPICKYMQHRIFTRFRRILLKRKYEHKHRKNNPD
jgi:hypothetical protein